jgi:general secretion pathway protein A
MLLNLETGDQFLINIVLSGVSEVTQTLAKYQELDQMFAVRERLQPLSVAEMGEMILHRLRCAGYTGDNHLFDADAILELHRFTKGVPRMVCHLADHALMMGKLLKARSVDGMLMHEAIEEFYGDEEEVA